MHQLSQKRGYHGLCEQYINICVSARLSPTNKLVSSDRTRARAAVTQTVIPVSYTHLDVYKRQVLEDTNDL